MEALCCFLFVACYFDYQYRKIPNWLSGIILTAGLARSLSLQGWSGVLLFLLRVMVLMVLLYPLFKLGMLGAGDVKLFGVCSGYFSYDKILYFLFFSMLVAAIISFVKMLIEQSGRERLVYLGDYLMEVVRTGRWHLYLENERDCYKNTIPLAGPVLVSVLLHIGGVY